jgi:cytochrome c peroxidase
MAPEFSTRRALRPLCAAACVTISLSWVFTAGCSAGASSEQASPTSHDAPYPWRLPRGFPKPVVPADNPMSIEKVELGRLLFYDRRLSKHQNFSCATCHRQEIAFTDDMPRSLGSTGQGHPRGAMSLANVAYASVLTWANPRMVSLEAQALVPMFGEHPIELGLAGREAEFLARLGAEPRYRELFPRVFPGETDPITTANVTKAIAAFERTLISGRSRYDRFVYDEEREALSAGEKRGMSLFFSERLACSHCHSGFAFADSTVEEGKPGDVAFHNTGLYNLDGKGAFPEDNQGIFVFTGVASDMGRMKAPTLRNIAVTAPYMHDGTIDTLEEVIDHYAAGGRTIVSGEYAGVGATNPFKSEFVRGFVLTPEEKADLLGFLRALTDEDFLKGPAFADPWPPASGDM